MSNECAALFAAIDNLDEKIELYRGELQDLADAIAQMRSGNSRDTIIGWVRTEMGASGELAPVLGATATGYVLTSTGFKSVALSAAGASERSRANAERAFGIPTQIERLDKTTKLNAKTAAQAQKEASDASVQARKTLQAARDAKFEAIKSGRGVARNSASLNKKANVKDVNTRFGKIRKNVSRLNVDLGKLGGKIAKNTSLGRAALKVGQTAQNLYKRIPGPLRTAIRTGARALAIASSILSVIESLATMALIDLLQKRIDVMQRAISLNGGLISRLFNQVVALRRTANGARAIGKRALDEGKQISEALNGRVDTVIENTRVNFREVNERISKETSQRFQQFKGLESQISGVRSYVKREVSGLRSMIQEVLQGQAGLSNQIRDVPNSINQHTTATIGTVVAAAVAVDGLKTRKQVAGLGGKLGPNLGSGLDGIRNAAKGALAAATAAASQARRNGTYARTIEPNVIGKIRRANQIGSREAIESANRNWERLTNRGKLGQNNQLLKQQKARLDQLGRQQAQASPKLTRDINRLNGKVNTVNDKLGPQITSKGGRKIGISGRLKNMWRTNLISQTLNVLNTILLLHNAAMLSRNLVESIGDMFSLTIEVIQRKVLGKDPDETPPIDVNQLIGQGFNGLMNDIFGKQLWKTIIIKWNGLNRILTAAANVAYSVRNMFDGVTGAIEIAANNTGKIGNALKNSRVVEQGSYAFMPTNTAARTGRGAQLTNFLQNASDIPDLGSAIAGEVLSVDDEARELGTNLGNLSNKVEQERIEKQAEQQAKRQSSSGSDLSLADFIPGLGGNDN